MAPHSSRYTSLAMGGDKMRGRGGRDGGNLPKSNTFINLYNQELESGRRRGSTGRMASAWRVISFFLVVFILPTVLISLPLYARYHLYHARHMPMTETDTRALNYAVSSFWCQGQRITSNGSVDAFLLSGEPQVKAERRHVSIKRNMTLTHDDIEYWGVYLLKGSSFSISSSARWPGGVMLVVQGEENLRKCFYRENRVQEQLQQNPGSVYKGPTDNEVDGRKIPANRGNIGTYGANFGPNRQVIGKNWGFDANRGNIGRYREIGNNQDNIETKRGHIGGAQGNIGGNRDNIGRNQDNIGGNRDNIGRNQDIGTNRDDIVVNRETGAKNRDISGGLMDEEGRWFEEEDFDNVGGEIFDDLGDDFLPTKDDGDTDRDIDGDLETDDDTDRRTGAERKLKPETDLDEVDIEIEDDKLDDLAEEPHKYDLEARKNRRRKGKRKNKKRRKNRTDPQHGRTRRSALGENNHRSILGEHENPHRSILDEHENHYPSILGESEHTHQFGENVRMGENDPIHQDIDMNFDPLKYFNDTGLVTAGISSYSSSEEFMENCRNAILMVELDPYIKWEEHISNSDAFNMTAASWTFDANSSDYFYFIFTSDNNYERNDLGFQLDLLRATYDVSAPIETCKNSSECVFPLTFTKSETVVVEVPAGEELLELHSFEVITACQPRVPVYMVFILLVPFIILLFAFQ